MLASTVDITRSIRRVRGGSQAYLVEGHDGHTYIAKFKSNPQGTRTLVNEWIADWFFRALGITTPEIRLLRLSENMIGQADFHFQVGSRRVSVGPGLHLGSQCPANPNERAIFDFLPDTCLGLVSNLDDFGKALVPDVLLGQTDARQAVFIRDRSSKNHKPIRAYLIDHGLMFGGSRWIFEDPTSSPYNMHAAAYSLIDLNAICSATVELAKSLAATDLFPILQGIPAEWLEGDDRQELGRLIQQLFRRLDRLEKLVRTHVQLILRRGEDHTRSPGGPAVRPHIGAPIACGS
ncbi:MAG: hypothetical protein JOZ32_12155 [Bryobacterales bacterium]|nr:hypothetical protein [Bryobacterales bacterium]